MILTFFDRLGADVAYALRGLRRSPGFALAAILSLALGIGANAAIFTVLNAVLLRDLPVRDPEQLVVLVSQDAARDADRAFSFRTLQALRSGTRTIAELFASAAIRMNVDEGRGMSKPTASGQLVSGNYFRALGVAAVIGRTILPEDDGAESAAAVAVLGYGYWQRQFGADAAVIGRTIRANGYPVTIVGVAAPEFFGTHVGEAIDVWVPLSLQPQVNPEFGLSLVTGVGADDTWLELMARLRPGAEVRQAQAELDTIYQQLLPEMRRKAGPKAFMIGNPRLRAEPGSKGLSELRRRFSRPLTVLMAVVGLVLLIACANVANLLLARAAARRREMAIRVSLGAGRARLVRQLLTESLVLAVAGGATGLLIASWTTQSLSPLLVGTDTNTLAVRSDAVVLGFTFGISLATGVLFGLAPAVGASRPDLRRDLAGTHRFGLAGVLVSVQVATSLVLLVGAGLFVRTLMNLRQLDLGFDREHVLVLRLEPEGSNQKRGNEVRLRRMYDSVIDRVRALPGVRDVSLSGTTPLGSENLLMAPDIEVSGYVRSAGEKIPLRMMQIYPGYFSTLGIPLLAGRDLELADDNIGAPSVAVINETLARQLFTSAAAAVGRSFVLPNRRTFQIVGVVRDTRDRALREAARPLAYATYAQTPTGRGQMTLLVRTTGDPHAIVAAVRQFAREIDPAMPLAEPQTLSDRADAGMRQERLVALLSALFSILALVLAIIGLYGVLAYAVARRQAEFGVRLALGASPARLTRLVLGESLVVVATGLVAGMVLAATAAGSVSHLLYGLGPFDPTAFLTASALLVVVAMLAAYLPARAASRVDPMIALRQE
jgi:predicted permease